MSKILINQYRRDLETRKRYGGSHNEGAIRYAFATLLNGYCQPRDFVLVEELTITSGINTNIRLDGIVKDALRLDWGYWEAKNEIVKFMVESTDYLLAKHFDKTLGSKEVEILDPCTGTGTFITEILDYLLTKDISYKYANEIHCNEVSILPYYIANLNIEYTYQQRTGEYLEFKNICLMDTLLPTDKGEKQLDMFAMNLENSERIKRQNERKISVIIGNPPYNAKQANFNDNNANLTYPDIDNRIKLSYIKEGTAQNQIVVYDMYTRFIRWATDRLNDDGIIAFVSNSSFIDALAFDGFRKIIAEDFNEIWIINTKGNARNSGERRRQEGGNVFSDLIKVGIAVYFLIKNTKKQGFKIYYHALDDYLRADDKKAFFVQHKLENIDFKTLTPDIKHNWINLTDNDFDELIPLIDKDVKANKVKAVKNEATGKLENKVCEEAIFQLFSVGVETTRDEWVYDFSLDFLEEKVKFFIEKYNQSINNNKKDLTIKWSSSLDRYFNSQIKVNFDKKLIHYSLYRPFIKINHYGEKILNHRLTKNHYEMYLDNLNTKNTVIVFSGVGTNKPFYCISSFYIVDRGFIETCQCLPLYRYEKGERIDNITDWGLEKFRNKYEDKKIKKEDIFNYVYGVLHNPEYRQKYELNLKREFPRIPFYDDFWQWAKWGKQLMDLHLNYETIKPYQLKRIDIPLNNELATPKPKLKADKIKGKITLDEVTTLEKVPLIAFDYKLGNRSALEWILDQYKEKKPRDKTIAEKFNNYRFADYKEEVINLLMRVTTVSVETMKIIKQMNR